MKSPHLQWLRVNYILFSNPTSSNTTSLNSRLSFKPLHSHATYATHRILLRAPGSTHTHSAKQCAKVMFISLTICWCIIYACYVISCFLSNVYFIFCVNNVPKVWTTVLAYSSPDSAMIDTNQRQLTYAQTITKLKQ